MALLLGITRMEQIKIGEVTLRAAFDSRLGKYFAEIELSNGDVEKRTFEAEQKYPVMDFQLQFFKRKNNHHAVRIEAMQQVRIQRIPMGW